MQYSSLEKGDLFEKFVSDQLFKASDYDLIHRTNTFNQNKSRYAEDTLKPDFKFRCKKTQQEFYVEAKYRSGFNANNMIEVISYAQIERFKIIQKKENTPFFIAVGYGDIPENPHKVSLIPLNELSNLKLYGSFLRGFNIEKGPVDSRSLNLPRKQAERENGLPLNEKTKESVEAVEEILAPRSKIKIVIAAATIGLIFIAFLMFNGFNASIEDTLKQKTTEYYNTLHSGNIDALENYISPNVDKWYSQSNISLAGIRKDTKAYIKRHPATNTEIQWDTFKVTPLNDDYAVPYNMIYKQLKENKGRDIIYHLKIHAIWGKDLKIKSLYEEKI